MSKIIFFFIYLIFCSFASAKTPTLCLNMIVKDESPVICRCLASVKPFIDYWVIVDTGSTDGTQELIRKFMKDIPGELYERPWVDFAHNRNEAMQLAKGKGDYLFFIDADEVVQVSETFSKKNLKLDAYFVEGHGVEQSGKPLKFSRVLVVNNHLNWSWKGVLHEHLVGPFHLSCDTLSGIEFVSTSEDGHRDQDPKKYFKDIEVLEKALIKEPRNARYVFYLAYTYEEVKNYGLALKNFEKRAKMGGSEQEIYYSLYSAGKMKEKLQMDTDSILDSYSRAFQFRPSRAEPLYHLAKIYMQKKNYSLAYAVAKLGVSLPMSSDQMLVETWIYEYGLPYYCAASAFELKKYDEAAFLYEKVLSHPDLPDEMKDLAKVNLLSMKVNQALRPGIKLGPSFVLGQH